MSSPPLDGASSAPRGFLVAVDTKRATTRALTGPRALDERALRTRAEKYAALANQTLAQPFAQALANPPLDAVKKRAAGFVGEDVVLFGIGGSALGPTTIYEALRPASPWKGKRLHVLDHLDPGRCHATITEGWQRGAHFCVISKSGDTTETMALATILDQVARSQGGGTQYGAGRVTIVTNEIVSDGGKPSNADTVIRHWAQQIGAPCVDMPFSLGGRYSVLSAVGLLPAALLGYDVDALVAGAKEMLARLSKVRDPKDAGVSGIGHEALELASALVGLDTEKGCGVHVVMPYLHSLERFGAWFVQLWAESLGKHTRTDPKKSGGPSGPIGGVGPTDQHSFAQLLLQGRPDKVLVLLDVQGDGDPGAPLVPSEAFGGKLEALRGKSLGQILATECFATELALAEVERPVIAIRTATFDTRVLGALFVLFEATTYLAGHMYDVDPYDQPGVQLIKRYIKDGLSSGVGPKGDARLTEEWSRNGGYPRQLPRK